MAFAFALHYCATDFHTERYSTDSSPKVEVSDVNADSMCMAFDSESNGNYLSIGH